MKKSLTKQDLVDLGIKVELNGCEYKVYHYGPISGYVKQKVWKPLKISTATCKHKYGVDRVYPIVAFSHNNKYVAITLSRLVYAWFKGDIPEGMDIDHIDNNPFNNNINNLQVLSHKENIGKRGQGKNQFNYNWSDEKRLEVNMLSNHIKSLQCLKKRLNSDLKGIKEHKASCDNIFEWRAFNDSQKRNRELYKQTAKELRETKDKLINLKGE